MLKVKKNLAILWKRTIENRTPRYMHKSKQPGKRTQKTKWDYNERNEAKTNQKVQNSQNCKGHYAMQRRKGRGKAVHI